MKKIVLALTALAIAFASCSNGSDGSLFAGIAQDPAVTGGTDTTGSPTTTPGTSGTDTPTTTPGGTPGTDVPGGRNGGATGGITVDDGTVTINSSKMVFIGDDTETIDGVEYKVKKYAQLVIDDNPYFYTYYKLYYLNDKLRRFYSFDHGTGCDMDYKYDEFVEHQCGERDLKNKTSTTTAMLTASTDLPKKIYTYYEDGKIESYIKSAYYTPTTLTSGYAKDVFEYYSNGAVKVNNTYLCTNTNDLNAAASWALLLKYEYEYHSNGKTKQIKTYSNTNTNNPSEGTMYLSKKETYTESGKTESTINYSADGTETSKTLYTYYDNGNAKTQEGYSNGKLWAKIAYYESGNPQKAESFNSDGKLYQIYTFYDEKGTNSAYISNGSGSSINLSGKQKLFACYSSYTNTMYGTGTTIWYLQNIAYYYSSGYIKHYYMGMNPNLGGGSFYTYADNKTKTSSYDSSVYSTTESMTSEQAEAKLAELLNE